MRTVNYRETIHQANLARFGEPRTLDELGHYMVRVINYRIAPNRVLGLAFNLSYRDDVSNTHSSPIYGRQNFDRQEDLPKGYPGWTGRVWIRYAERPKSFGSSPIEWTQTHTGSGGLGSYNGPWEDLSRAYYKAGNLPVDELPIYSWDYRIFRKDWPEISRQWEQRQIMRILHNDLAGEPMYSFRWGDPEQADIDRKIEEAVWNT